MALDELYSARLFRAVGVAGFGRGAFTLSLAAGDPAAATARRLPAAETHTRPEKTRRHAGAHAVLAFAFAHGAGGPRRPRHGRAGFFPRRRSGRGQRPFAAAGRRFLDGGS